MKKLLPALLLLLSFVCFSQSDKSLETQYLKIAKSPQTVDELNNLLINYKDSLQIAKNKNQELKVGFYSLIVSRVFYKLGSFNNSIEYADKAVSVYENTTDTTFILFSYVNIGSIYGALDQKEIALEYFDKIEKIALESNNTRALSHNYINKGITCAEKDPLNSLKYYNKAREYINQNENKGLITFYLLNNEGALYYRLNEYEKSLNKFKLALQRVDSNHMYYSSLLSNIGQVYLYLNKPDSALIYLNKAISVPKELQSVNDLVFSYSVLTDLYIEKKNIDSVKKYLGIYKIFNDSLIVNKKAEFTSKIKVIYETNKLIDDIEARKAELKVSQTNIMYLSIFGIVVTISLIVFFIFYRKLRFSYKNILKESVKYVKLEKENIQLKDALQNKTNKSSNSFEKNIEKSEELYYQIIELFERKKIFLEKDITINKLAEILGSNRTYISNVINSKGNMSFVKLLNQYRVREAKRMLIDDSNNMFTLDAIGKTCGFNSTSTFNRVFKNETGLTPSFYVKNKSSF